MRSDCELMEIHASVLFKHDQAGRLTSMNEPGDQPAPLFYLGGTIHGTVERYHQSLDDTVVNALRQAVEQAPWMDAPNQVNLITLIRILNQNSPIEQMYAGPAFVFPDVRKSRTAQAIRITRANIGLLSDHFSDYCDDVDHGQPFFAVVQNQAAVAVCCSARQTSAAAEASLRTAKDFRGKGCAAAAAAAWAAEVQNEGRIALYSTSWNNLSSQAVARKLHLKQYGVDLHFR